MAALNEQVDKIVKAPIQQKLGVMALLMIGLTTANYFLAVDPAREQFNSKKKELATNDAELVKMQAIANNIGQFRKDKETLERCLTQALTELPNETNMDELVHSLSEMGNKSGLSIGKIEPQAEANQGFYNSIPLAMSVTGNYHEIAVFFDAISRLPRIVNVAGLHFAAPRMKNEKEIIDAEFTATTFRFAPQDQAAPAVGAGGSKPAAAIGAAKGAAVAGANASDAADAAAKK